MAWSLQETNGRETVLVETRSNSSASIFHEHSVAKKALHIPCELTDAAVPAVTYLPYFGQFGTQSLSVVKVLNLDLT